MVRGACDGVDVSRVRQQRRHSSRSSRNVQWRSTVVQLGRQEGGKEEGGGVGSWRREELVERPVGRPLSRQRSPSLRRGDESSHWTWCELVALGHRSHRVPFAVDGRQPSALLPERAVDGAQLLTHDTRGCRRCPCCCSARRGRSRRDVVVEGEELLLFPKRAGGRWTRAIQDSLRRECW